MNFKLPWLQWMALPLEVRRRIWKESHGEVWPDQAEGFVSFYLT